MPSIVADGTVDAATYGRNKAFVEIGQKPIPFPDRVQEALRNRTFVASQSTLRRMSGDVMGSLGEYARQGLGVRDAAGLLQSQFEGMRDFELRRIARTEINRAQQDAAMTTEQELGIQYHQWVTASDERVRSSHRDQHNEIVAVGRSFSNGLKRPGDPSGPLSEVVNCRCRIAPFLVPRGMIAPVDMAQFHASDLRQVTA